MKQETLKKIVELAEGFSLNELYPVATFKYSCGSSATGSNSCRLKIITIWQHYALLLRRAVEGCEHVIIFDNKKRITCLSLKDDKQTIEYSDYQRTDYLTPQEQAIEACLIELLEDKDEE